MKRVVFILCMCLLSQLLCGQDLIKLINGKSFFADIQSVNDASVVYKKSNRIITTSKEEIALIEYLEGGVEYFHKESLQTIDPKSIQTPVSKRGNKVYIPFSSDNVAHRCGALKLRELVSESRLWVVVDCEEESHFIMEFVYSDEGKDHGYVNILNRQGRIIYQTPIVRNSDIIPTHKGEEIAEKIYKKYIKCYISFD